MIGLIQLQLLHMIIAESCSIGIVIRILLMLSGDIEMNPGPVTNKDLIEGLASLVTAAPDSVKPVLGVWAIDKNDMVQEWNSTKFTPNSKTHLLRRLVKG